MFFKKFMIFVIVFICLLFLFDSTVYSIETSEVESSEVSIMTQALTDFLDNSIVGESSEKKLGGLLKYYSENRVKNNKKLSYKNVIFEEDKWLFRKEISPNIDILKERNEKSSIYTMIGRLYIPNINIDIAVFNTNAQEVVDAKDSAACFKSGDTFLVADHWYSGFERIKNCKEGDIAFIDTGETVYEFKCVGVIEGHNTGKLLTDGEGNSIMYKKNTDGLTLYTCMDCWQNVRIAFFQPNNSYVPVDKLR